MILNRAEFALVTNPLRPAVLRWYEIPRLRRLGGLLNGGYALEIGCGPGFALSSILDHFGANRVDGFDLDPRMVNLARARHRDNTRVSVWVGDVSAIAAADETYDALFDFGIIHHVPEWRTAVHEIFRVLKPGGRVYMEEVLAGFIRNPLVRRILHHPLHDRFDGAVLQRQMESAGFAVIRREDLFSAFTWIAAEKPPGRF